MFVHHQQLIVSRGEDPLNKLPPGWELHQPGLHRDRGPEVVLLGEEIRPELLDGGSPVAADDLPAVLGVVVVLLQAGVLPQPLQLVPVC